MLNRFATLGHWACVRWLCSLLVCMLLAPPAFAAGEGGTDGPGRAVRGGTGGGGTGGGGTGSGGTGGTSGGGSSGSGGGGSGGRAWATDPPVVKDVKTTLRLTPTEVMRGGTVTITGENLPGDDATIWLDDINAGQPLSVSKDHTSLVFIVPDREGAPDMASSPLLPARRYVLSFSVGAGPKISAGVLRVTPEKLPPLRLDGVSPTIVYGDTKQLLLNGDGLGGRIRDYALLLDGAELKLCVDEQPDECRGKTEDKPEHCCRGLKARFASDHQLEIFGSTEGDTADGNFRDATGQALSGDHMIGLRAGDAVSVKTIPVAFTKYTAGGIRFGALVAAGLLLGFMVWLVMKGSNKHTVGTKEFALGAFLLDTETDTYSLSKLQFYLWSMAALFAYTYLSLSRCLVQGKFDIADIPQNLPSILGISAATAVTSIGISKVRGPKASGVMHPQLSDLVTAGGVVSPERFTFLLWTIVAIALFLLNVWNVDAMVLNDLPKIPQGLLELSGISSAAYLGGKFARGPGPVVDEVLSVPPSDSTKESPPNALLLMGRNLATDATFEVDGKPITQLLDSKAHPDRRAIVGKREEGERAGQYAKALTIVLSSLPEAWLKALKVAADPEQPLKVTVANPDGQRAEVEVPRTVLTPPKPADTESAGSAT